MKLLCELKRYSFVWKRDGYLAAVSTARQGIEVYRSAAKHRRLKHGRRDAYRRLYVESAWAFRWLLQHVYPLHNK